MNFSKKAKNIIRELDYFGTIVSFRLGEDLKYKSLIGGTCTIIYIIIALIYILYMLIPFLKREEINFTFSNKIISKNPFVNLSSTNINFAFGALFSSDQASAIENTTKYFDYKINIIEWVGIDDFFEKEIFFNFCNQSDYPSSLDDQFEVNELNELYCLLINKNNINYLNYSLDGLYTDDYFKFITIDFFLNEYGKNNFDEVKIYLRENPLLMSLFFVDTAIDYENRHVPLPVYINYITRDIDFDYTKKSEIFFSSLEFINDDNFFFNKESLTKNVMFDRSEDSFRFIQDRNEEENYNLFHIEIKVSPKVTTLKRKYQKLPEFVASLSGLLSFLLVFIFVCCNLIERKAINQELIHRMLKFRGNKNININYLIDRFKNLKYTNEFEQNEFLKKKIDEKKNDHNSKENMNEKIIKLFSNMNVESIPNIKKNIEETKETSKREKEYFYTSNSTKSLSPKKKKKNSVNREKTQFIKSENIFINQNTNLKPKNEVVLKKLNMIEIICNFFCFCCSPRLKKNRLLLAQAENKINYYMDIHTYIRTVQEFELLKDIFFDKKSLTLFHFLSKCSVKIINNNLVFLRHFEKELKSNSIFKEIEIDKLYYSYQKMIFDKSNLGKEKLKLLDFLKNEINFLE